MRKKLIGAAGVLAAVLVTAASAWACTNLASLNISSPSGNPGTRLDISGTAYATKGGSDVVIRWDSLTGPVLASVKPDAAGTIHGSVTVPADARPGPHVILATQDYTDAQGVTTAAYGTPARAGFTIGAVPAAPPAPEAAATSAAAGDSSGTSTGLIALTIALGVGGLALFGAGLAVLARQTRRRPTPAPVQNTK
jgi:hypothetical protein